MPAPSRSATRSSATGARAWTARAARRARLPAAARAEALSWTPPPREPWVDHLNALGENLGDDGRRLVPLDEATCWRRASATGLDDFGDDWFRTPLANLSRRSRARLASICSAASSRAARSSASSRTGSASRTGSRHPELRRERIEAPIFVTGLGRSGHHAAARAADAGSREPRAAALGDFFSVPPPEPATHERPARRRRTPRDHADGRRRPGHDRHARERGRPADRVHLPVRASARDRHVHRRVLRPELHAAGCTRRTKPALRLSPPHAPAAPVAPPRRALGAEGAEPSGPAAGRSSASTPMRAS